MAVKLGLARETVNRDLFIHIRLLKAEMTERICTSTRNTRRILKKRTYIPDRGVSCTAVDLAAVSGKFGFVLLYLYGVTLRVNCTRVLSSFC